MSKRIVLGNRDDATDPYSRLVDEDDLRVPRYKLYGRGGDEPEIHPSNVLIISIVLLLSLPCRFIYKKFGRVIPYQVLLILVSTIIAACIHQLEMDPMYYNPFLLQSTQFTHILDPVLVFHATINVEFHAFLKTIGEVLAITLIRYIFEMVILTSLLLHIVHIEKIELFHAILFALMFVPTYPSNIIETLKSLGEFKNIIKILELETVITLCNFEIAMAILYKLDILNVTDYKEAAATAVAYVSITVILSVVLGFLSCYCFDYLIKDTVMMVMFTFAMIYFTYYSAKLCKVNKIACMVTVAMFIGKARSKLSREEDARFMECWDILYHIVYTIIFCFAHVCGMLALFDNLHGKHIYSMIIFYIITNVIRCLSFLISYPLLIKISYHFNVRSTILISLLNIKDIPNVIIALSFYRHPELNFISHYFVTHAIGLEILTHMINGTLITQLLNLLGLSDISIGRRTNMNTSVKYIEKLRLAYLQLIKCNRLFAAANWDAIQNDTILQHPYKSNIHDLQEQDDRYESKEATCPECHISFYIESSVIEKKEILREALNRVYKAKRVSYIKQYEEATLTMNGRRTLINEIESMFSQKKLELTFFVLDKATKIPECVLRLTSWLHKRVTVTAMQLTEPKESFCRICYYIHMHVAFDPIGFSVIIIYTGISLLFLLLPQGKEHIYIIVLFILHIIFWLEFLIKVYSLSSTCVFPDGIRNYFRFNWNIINFIALVIISFVHVWLTLPNSLTSGILKEYQIWTRYILISYAYRLLRLTKYAFPILKHASNAYINKKMLTAYDLGVAIMNSDDYTKAILPLMIDDSAVRAEINKVLEDRHLDASKKLANMSKERPVIAITVKTKQAMSSVLNMMKIHITELKQSGYVDTVEYEKLRDCLDKRYSYIRSLKFIQPTSPEEMFREVPWMTQEDEICDYLYSKAKIVKYETDDIITIVGSIPEGIYILISGMVKLEYQPDNKESQVELFGAIPVVDYLSRLVFDKPFEDYIVPGNSIGAFSLLTKRPYSCTITASSTVELFLIPAYHVDDAMRYFSDSIYGLEAKLWKFSTLELSIHILKDTLIYQMHTHAQLMKILDRAFVPNLSNFKVFVVNDLLEDLILLDGILVDYSTREVFEAPCYIPRTCHKLVMNSSLLNIGSKIATKLLVIPAKDLDVYDIMVRLTELGEMINDQLQISRSMTGKKRGRTLITTKRKTHASSEIRARSDSAAMSEKSDATRSVSKLMSENFLLRHTGMSVLKELSEIKRRSSYTSSVHSFQSDRSSDNSQSTASEN